MIYYCHFPNCDFSTLARNHIHYHHIIPKELGGKNDHSNRVFLCPTHHAFIYVPEQKEGQHSLLTEDSIILHGWRKSTSGRVLLYEIVNTHQMNMILEK